MTPDAHDTTAPPDYDRLVAALRDRYGDAVRWVASCDTDADRYEVRCVRRGLETERSSHDLDVVIHRSIALFDRPYVEEAYRYLGDVQALILQHERATAVHVYLGPSEGFVVKVRAGEAVTLPAFVDDCLAALYGTESAS